MYLTPGKGTVVPEWEVIGIFDLDNCSQSHLTREFLTKAERAGNLQNAAEDLPNAFLVTERSVILSQTASRSFQKRYAKKNGENHGGYQ